jgi:hypothetical protein
LQPVTFSEIVITGLTVSIYADGFRVIFAGSLWQADKITIRTATIGNSFVAFKYRKSRLDTMETSSVYVTILLSN